MLKEQDTFDAAKDAAVVSAIVELAADARNVFSAQVDVPPDFVAEDGDIGQIVIVHVDTSMVERELCRMSMSGSPRIKPIQWEDGSIYPSGWSLQVALGGRYGADDIWINDELRSGAIKTYIIPRKALKISGTLSTYAAARSARPLRHHSVALDAVGAGIAYTGVGTGGVSWSHTLGSGSDFALDISGANQYPTQHSTTAATYDGVSWTSRGDRESSTIGTPGFYTRSSIFGEKAPPAGTKTAAVTFTDSSNAGFFQSRSWTGVDQGTPYGTATTGEGSNPGQLNTAGAVSTPANGALIDAFGSGGSVGLTPSHTQDFADALTVPQVLDWGAGQHTFSSGSQTLSWTTVSASDFEWAQVILPLNASTGGGSRPVKMAGYWGGFAGESGGFAG